MSWGLPFLKSGDHPECMDNPNLFWPEKRMGPNKERWELETRSNVRRVCDACPFLTECSAYAIQFETDGWWANLSPTDRQKIRREQGIEMHKKRPGSGKNDWVALERKHADRKSRTAIWLREGMRENSRQMFQNYNEQVSKGKATA